MNNIKQRILSAVCAVIFISAFTLSVSADVPAHTEKKPPKVSMLTTPNWHGFTSQNEMCKAIGLGYMSGNELYPKDFADASGNLSLCPFYHNYPYYMMYGYSSVIDMEKDIDAGYKPGDTRNSASDKDVYYTSSAITKSGGVWSQYIYGVGSVGAAESLSKEVEPAVGAAIMITATVCGWKFDTEDEQKNFINGYLKYAKDKIGSDLTQLYTVMNNGTVQLTQLGQQLALQYMAQYAGSANTGAKVTLSGFGNIAMQGGVTYIVNNCIQANKSYTVSFYSYKSAGADNARYWFSVGNWNYDNLNDCKWEGYLVHFHTTSDSIVMDSNGSIVTNKPMPFPCDVHIMTDYSRTCNVTISCDVAGSSEGNAQSVSAQPASKSTDIPCDAAHVLGVPITTTPDELLDADYTKVADIAKSVDLTKSGDIAGTADPTQPWQQSDTNIDFRPFLAIDLTKVFPFCLPFDIVNAFKLFVANPAAPKWDIKMPYVNKMFTGFDYTVDLSQFETWAVISRWFFYILFCIGMTMVTGKLIKH